MKGSLWQYQLEKQVNLSATNDAVIWLYPKQILTIVKIAAQQFCLTACVKTAVFTAEKKWLK